MTVLNNQELLTSNMVCITLQVSFGAVAKSCIFPPKMSVPMAVMCKQARCYWIPFNWTLVFFGNLVGTCVQIPLTEAIVRSEVDLLYGRYILLQRLFWDALLIRYSGIFTQPYAAYAIKFAAGKVITPTWGQIFLRGVGCNILVCLAVWQASEYRYLFLRIRG